MAVEIVSFPLYPVCLVRNAKRQCIWYSLNHMNWLFWALLSAFFAGATAVLAKIGVSNVNSNLATAIRTTVVLFFTWGLALATATPSPLAKITRSEERRV